MKCHNKVIKYLHISESQKQSQTKHGTSSSLTFVAVFSMFDHLFNIHLIVFCSIANIVQSGGVNNL